jgi:hypothetical protein
MRSLHLGLYNYVVFESWYGGVWRSEEVDTLLLGCQQFAMLLM